MEKFQNKYRTQSFRLKNWDYRSNGLYFITICTKDREHFFGEVENNKMLLSQIGVIADLIWYEIINHSKNIELGEFVVMPNHIHGILILDGDCGDVAGGDVACNISTDTVATDADVACNICTNEIMSKISPKANSISSIIRNYKSAVTKHAHRLGFDFEWQSLFHDHIIRNERSHTNIRNYIINNPLNWKEDKFHKQTTNNTK